MSGRSSRGFCNGHSNLYLRQAGKSDHNFLIDKATMSVYRA